MDMHVHLMILGHADYEHWDKTYMARFRDEIMPIAAKQLLMSGVTTVRDLGAPLDEILHVKKRIAAGEIPGRGSTSRGPFIQHRPYFEYEKFVRWGVDGPDDARAKVQKLGRRRRRLHQADRPGPDDGRRGEGRRRDREEGRQAVVAHAHREDEIRIGLKYGVDCFEHTGLATSPGYPRTS
jgi:hypothetical protein